MNTMHVSRETTTHAIADSGVSNSGVSNSGVSKRRASERRASQSNALVHKPSSWLALVALAFCAVTMCGCNKDTPKSSADKGKETESPGVDSGKKEKGTDAGSRDVVTADPGKQQTAAVQSGKPDTNQASSAANSTETQAPLPIPQVTEDTLAGNVGDYAPNTNGHPDHSRTGTWSYLSTPAYAGAEDARFQPMGWDSSTNIRPHYEVGGDNQDGKYRRPYVLEHTPKAMEIAPSNDREVVVRWTNANEKWLRIRGVFRKAYPKNVGRDGVHVWVMCDGLPRFYSHLPDTGPGVAFDFTTEALPGARIDFVVRAGIEGHAFGDLTHLFACIDRADENDRSKEYATWVAQVKQQFEEAPKTPLSTVAVKLGKAERDKARLELAREIYVEPYLQFGDRANPRDKEVMEYLERVAEFSLNHKSVRDAEALLATGLELTKDRSFANRGHAVWFAHANCLVWSSFASRFELNSARVERVRTAADAMQQLNRFDGRPPNIRRVNMDKKYDASHERNKARILEKHAEMMKESKRVPTMNAVPIYGATAQLLRVELSRGATYDRKNEWMYGLDRTLDYLFEVMSDKEMTNARRSALLEKVTNEIDNTALYFRYRLLLGRLQQDNDVDPWLKAMLTGRGMVKVAWQARGNGYASTVSKDGWRIHKHNMASARTEFLKAWQLIPELPESAQELLRSTAQVGGVAEETPRFWFDRAVEAEFDFAPAYTYLTESVLRPRWGGSHEKMLEFGRECVTSGQFETSVPWVFHTIVGSIKSELDDRSAIYEFPGMFETYQELLVGYRDASNDPQRQNRMTSQLAAVAFNTGKHDTAGALLDELGDDFLSSGFTQHDTSWLKVATALDKLRGNESPPNRDVTGQPDDGTISADLAGYHGSDRIQEIRLDPTKTHLVVTHRTGGHSIWPTKLGFSSAFPIKYTDDVNGANLAPHAHLGGDLSLALPLFAAAGRVSGRVARQSENPLRLLNPATGRTQEIFTPSAGVMYRVKFTPDGKVLAVGGHGGSREFGGNVVLINPKTGRAYDWGYLRHAYGIAGVACSSDSLQLAVAERFAVSVWDLPSDVDKNTKPLLKRFRLTTAPNEGGSIVFSPDGSKLAIADFIMTMIDVITGETMYFRNGSAVDFSPDSKLLVVGGGSGADISTDAEVIEVETQKLVATLKGGHSAAITAVAFLHDGKHVATGDGNGVIRVWNLDTQKLTSEYGELPESDTSPFDKRDDGTKLTPTQNVYNSIGMPFVAITPGEFTMGSPREEKGRGNDEDQHPVKITKPMLFGQFEVTQDEYYMVMNKIPSAHSLTGAQRNKLKSTYEGHLPVEQVSWHDAISFCQRLSSMPAEIDAGRTYRLPTEAEWEYVCRGGTSTAFSSGETLTPKDSNIVGQGELFDRPRTVGMYRPNKFGIYDMHGNVREWVQDWYGPYSKEAQVDPQGPDRGATRVMRGSAYRLDANIARSAKRHPGPPNFKGQAVGFRVVCEVATAP